MAKSMEEKLRKDYDRSVNPNNRIGGHRIAFYNETGEIIKVRYEFEKGRFNMGKMDPKTRFFWWDYEPTVDYITKKKKK